MEDWNNGIVIPEEKKTEMMGYVEKAGHFMDNSLLTELFSHKSKGAFQGLEGEY